MAKGKKKAVETDSYLDYLGIGGDQSVSGGTVTAEGEGESEGSQVADLLKSIESLTARMDTMQTMAARPAPMAAAGPAAPVAPKLREIALDGLPDQMEHPDEWAKGLNSRINEVVTENIRALSVYNAETALQAGAQEGRSSQLWDDFQTQYMDKLEEGLPNGISASSYVEVAARDVAGKAKRRGLDLNAYMYQTSDTFMEDVFKAANKVLAPLRVSEGGEEEADTDGSVGEGEVHRTGGIIGPGGVKDGKKGPTEETSTLISDLQEVQIKTGFF